jgi:hypothetical protein
MRIVFVLIAFLLLVPAAILVAGEGTPGTAVAITGPERLEVSTDGAYNVKIFGPSEINWGFWVNVSGADRADTKLASPDGTADSSKSYIMSQTTPLAYPEFNFTLTAPAKAGSLTVTVTALAMEGAGAAGQMAVSRWSVDVMATRLVQLNTTVHNGGEVAVQNLMVAFMVKLHGQWAYISNESVPQLDAGQTANVSTTWNSSLLDSGEYTVRIVVDPDRELAQYSGSGGTVDKLIVLRDVGAKEQQPPNVRLIGFIVVVAVISVGLFYWYRKKKIV